MLFYVRDRTLGAKEAVEVTPKPDISSASENKALPIVERIPSATVYSAVPIPTNYDEIQCELVPAIGCSSQQSPEVEGLLFHVNDQFETKCLRVGDDVCTNELETAPSQDLAKPITSIDSKLYSNDDEVI